MWINTKGDRFWNCGSEVFSQCNAKDVKWEVPMKISKGSHALKKPSNIYPFLHAGHVVVQYRDFLATDRANEGRWQMIQHVFQERSVLIKVHRYHCIPLGLQPRQVSESRRGVLCRNFKNCQCIYVYAPTTCEFKGDRGSLNSGPPTLSIMKSWWS